MENKILMISLTPDELKNLVKEAIREYNCSLSGGGNEKTFADTIIDWDLSHKCIKTLKDAFPNCTLDQFLSKNTEYTLLRVRGFGKKSLEELVSYLRMKNLSLRK
jgi:DNA-directed RNA polymerase alpha subunit